MPIEASMQHLTVKVSKSNHPDWFLTSVYASPNYKFHSLLWQQLIQFSKNGDLPWLVTGDFNAISSPDDKSRASSVGDLRRCQRFTGWINEALLTDMGFSGPRFTWFRGDSAATRKASRIDRTLCNDGWFLNFPNTEVLHLSKLHSDHLPILTSFVGQQASVNSSKFRFEAAWLLHPQLGEFLDKSWDKEAPLPNSLKDMAEKLQQWKKDVFGSTHLKKRRLIARLQGVTERLANTFYPGLLKLQVKLEKELDLILAQEEVFWFQRANEKWVKLGEQNTSFFHQQATRRRRRNKILTLRNENGEWIDNQESLRNMVLQFYTYLYTQEEGLYEDLMPRGRFPRLQQEELMELLRPFIISDFHRAIFEMKPMSAPGPDGFQAVFYQKFWPLVGKNLTMMATNFFETGSIPEELMESLVVLIPKIDHPETPAHFRPISLNNVALKAITKAMANRLKPLMPKLVAPTQSGFIKGRQTNDNILLLQETLHSLRNRKGKRGGIVIKIDLEKAYDRLHWSFLRDTLGEIGLPSTWINRIMTCVEKNQMRINWNGELTSVIKPSRGVRQGDPLSSFLFVLCMERLAHRIEQVVEEKLWKPIPLSKDGPKLSHLFFADDLILFAEAESGQIDVIRSCLEDFCLSSGQKVNLHKSAMFVSPNVHRDKAQRLSARAGISLTNDLGRYLGISAINGKVTKERYHQLLLKIQNKLATWKANHLSTAARITLVKSISSSMSIYPMFTERLPVSVCNNIDRINRRFVSGEEEGQTKFHPVGWEQLTLPKDHGGVGIRPTKLANQAMLAKGAWKLATGDSTLWVQVMRNKYGGQRQGLQILRKTKGGSFAWNSFTQTVDLLRKGAAINVKNGKLTKFWIDIWAMQVPLLEVTTMEVPVEVRNKSVADYWEEEGGWRFEDFEGYLPPEVINKIRSILLDPLTSSEDTMFWKHTANGLFSAKSAFQTYFAEAAPQDSAFWRRIWKLHCPERVRFFVWLATKEKLSTNSRRKIRHLTLDDKCPICKHTAETNVHCLRDCTPTRKIWEDLVPPHEHNTFFAADHTSWFQMNLNMGDSGERHEDWPSFFALVCWYIWKYRNEYIFQGKKLADSSFINYVKSKATGWLQAWERTSLQLDCNNKPNRTDRLVCWGAPPRGWSKMNTDGAAQGSTGMATAGGILRDSDGDWLGGFCCKIGTGSAILAELWGIHQ
ncbi:unnamed protein product [Linum trigynum]|uniref:Reverse transcriptase domain-containing protein n=1 Tax=Linum trigynum TaxID=586398 RepID=A0AAV2EDI1_9ROSI